jgi:hypothetical protein
MAVDVSCRACGVALPEHVGRCPACGARSRQWRRWIRVGLAVLVVFVVASGLALTHRPRVDPALAADVRAFPGIRQLSPDARGTDVSGHVENKARVPVDFIVRFRARDIYGRVGAEIESKRYRNLLPDSSTDVKGYFDMTPIETIDVDIVELARSPK